MNIFVARLNYDTQDEDLREAFEAFGNVSSAKVVMDRETGRSRGFGFVEMPNYEEGNAAIGALNDSELDGRTIVVKAAESRDGTQDRPRGGGGGGGYGGGGYGGARRDGYRGGGSAQNNEGSLSKFYFTLDWGSLTNIPFQEVSGLDIEAQPINYRHGNSTAFPETTMPGIAKNSSVIMKKGFSADGNIFWDWYNTIKTNTIQRQNIVIKLIDEAGNPMMIWTLLNAWPISIAATELESEENEVAIESIEINHEGLTVTNA